MLFTELNDTGMLALVQSLSNQLRDALNAPSENAQRAVHATRDAITTALREAQSNSISPGLRADLAELRLNEQPVSYLIGNGLLERLDKALSGGYNSVDGLDETVRLAEAIGRLQDALSQLITGASALALRTEQLTEGESVVGFTIPRKAVDEKLDHLQKEINTFSRLVSLIAEAKGEPKGPIKVRSLQSSDFTIDLVTTLSVTASVASLVQLLWNGLSKLRELSELKSKMQEHGLGKESLDEVAKRAATAIESEIEKFEVELFQNQKLDDEGRVNELKSGIRLHGRALASRLERGYSVEVRTTLPSSATKDERAQGKVITAAGQVRFEPIGVPLLELTDGTVQERRSADDQGDIAD